MRSAQRKNRIEKKKKKGQIYGLLIRVFTPLILVLSVVLFLTLNTKYWNGHDKMSFVYQNPNGDVEVVVLDPVLNEETTLVIPGDTEVDVARGYGTLRIKNIWQLGVNEKLGGKLLAQTLTDSFLFPTNLWNDRDLTDIWKFVFKSKATNIPFGDRLAVGIFSMRVTGIDKTEINLAKNLYLHKQTLTDGQPGYVMAGPMNGRLTVYFADNSFANSNLRFSLTDATGNYGVANDVGAILEVLGGKVVAVNKEQTNDSLDCEVFGANQMAVRKVSSLFACKVVKGDNNFDLVMRMGSKFAKRF